MDIKEMGHINISEDVLATIASLAASEIKGVANMQGSVTGSISELLGMKNFSKGVKVILSENKAVIDAHIMVEYGSIIQDVATKVQENIKSTVESMTDVNVESIDVYIEGVVLQQEPKIEA
ncbi:MAG: Asp23/Gls24 family envelope stress response protein [Filifactoraceae bacterium]